MSWDAKTTLGHSCIFLFFLFFLCIQNQHEIELANFIAERYKYLIEEKDQDSMTVLERLACNQTAFERKKIKMPQGFLEEFMISPNPTQGLKEMFNSQYSTFNFFLVIIYSYLLNYSCFFYLESNFF